MAHSFRVIEELLDPRRVRHRGFVAARTRSKRSWRLRPLRLCARFTAKSLRCPCKFSAPSTVVAGADATRGRYGTYRTGWRDAWLVSTTCCICTELRCCAEGELTWLLRHISSWLLTIPRSETPWWPLVNTRARRAQIWHDGLQVIDTPMSLLHHFLGLRPSCLASVHGSLACDAHQVCSSLGETRAPWLQWAAPSNTGWVLILHFQNEFIVEECGCGGRAATA